MLRFLRSFGFAFKGIRKVFLSGRNFRIQFFFGLVTCFLAYFFSISKWEWIILILVSVVVLAAEAFNSAIETICDLYTTEDNLKVEWIKDVSAGAVLICAIGAFLIGCIIFYPYLFQV